MIETNDWGTAGDRPVLGYAVPASAALDADGPPDLEVELRPLEPWVAALLPAAGIVLCLPPILLALAAIMFGAGGVSLRLVLITLPVLLLAIYVCGRCTLRLARLVQYGDLPARIVVADGQLRIEHPSKWGPTPRTWPVEHIDHVEVFNAGWNFDLSRVVCVRIEDGKRMNTTELNLRTQSKADAAQLKVKLCRTLGIPETGRRPTGLVDRRSTDGRAPARPPTAAPPPRR